jgi:hypothetical protein
MFGFLIYLTPVEVLKYSIFITFTARVRKLIICFRINYGKDYWYWYFQVYLPARSTESMPRHLLLKG